jgi:hypothetical protein
LSSRSGYKGATLIRSEERSDKIAEPILRPVGADSESGRRSGGNLGEATAPRG